jgi:hypothetical protein
MTDEIVARLRDADASHCMDSDHLFDGLLVDAADEIERLRAERDQARREACAFVTGRYRKDCVTLDRMAAIAEAWQRGWDCFKEKP